MQLVWILLDLDGILEFLAGVVDPPWLVVLLGNLLDISEDLDTKLFLANEGLIDWLIVAFLRRIDS